MAVTVRRNWDSDNNNEIDASVVESGAGSPLTTKGDIYTYDTANQRLPIGTDGQILSANSATATGLEWIANTGGGGSGTNTYVELTRTTNQTIATGSPGTVVQWENEIYDTDNLVDLGSSNTDIVIGTDGEYLLYFEFEWVANSTSFREISILVNGSPVTIVRDDPPSAGNAQLAGSGLLLNLVATDVITIRVRQDTGGNLDLTGTQLVRLVQFKAGSGGGGREILTANRTYYIDDTLGNDSNDGLSPGAGAFQTIQKGLDVAAMIDLAGFGVNLDVADGTYTLTQSLNIPFILGGILTITGNTGTPSNVVLDANGDYACITCIVATRFILEGLSFDHDTGGGGSGSRMGVILNGQADLTIVDCNFITGRYMMQLGGSSTTRLNNTHFISGTWDAGFRVNGAAYINALNSTFDITGAAHTINDFFFFGAGGVGDYRNVTYNTSSGGSYASVSPGTVSASILDVSSSTLPFANPTVSNNGTLIT